MCGGAGDGHEDLARRSGSRRRTTPRSRSPTRTTSSTAALAKLGPQPPNFRAIVELNTGPLLTESATVAALSPHQVESQRARRRARRRPARRPRVRRRARPGGGVDPGRRAGFGTKLAWLVRPGQPVVFVGRDDEDGRARGAARRRGRRAHVAGFLQRRDDELGAGGAARRADRAPPRARSCPRASSPTPACNSSTSASCGSGRPGTCRGSTCVPWHDLVDAPDGLDPRAAGRRALRDRPARGDGSRPPQAARVPRRDPRRRGRRRAPGPRLGLPLERAERKRPPRAEPLDACRSRRRSTCATCSPAGAAAALGARCSTSRAASAATPARRRASPRTSSRWASRART